MYDPGYMSDVQNLKCVVVRTRTQRYRFLCEPDRS